MAADSWIAILPAAYYSWGVALLKHGDCTGAGAKLADANMRGPHWADALKAWGDLLLKQGSKKEALAKYEVALKYAPNWAALNEVREEAAKVKALNQAASKRSVATHRSGTTIGPYHSGGTISTGASRHCSCGYARLRRV